MEYRDEKLKVKEVVIPSLVAGALVVSLVLQGDVRAENVASENVQHISEVVSASAVECMLDAQAYNSMYSQLTTDCDELEETSISTEVETPCADADSGEDEISLCANECTGSEVAFATRELGTGFSVTVNTETSAEMSKATAEAETAEPDITIENNEMPIEGIDAPHFNPYNVGERSNITLAQLKHFVSMLCPEWVGIEEQILTYDERVNVVFLVAVARLETWAGSACVGDYNCFNIRCGDGSYVDYNSYIESIEDFVHLIETQYLDPDGLWYEGTSIADINIHYAESEWAPVVEEIGYQIVDAVKNIS